MRTLIGLLLLTTAASASPVKPTETANGSVCLAVLLSLVSLLLLLLFLKHIFMKKRRKLQHSRSLMPGCSFDNSCVTRRSISIGPSDKKVGFFVGLFGSPTWETKQITMTTGSEFWTGPRQPSTFSTYRMYTKPQHYRTAVSQNWTPNSEIKVCKKSPSSATPARGGVRALFEIRDDTGLGHKKPRSFRLPVQPPKAYAGRSGASVSFRRFSLPTMSRKDIFHTVLNRRRPSSLRSIQTRRSDMSASSFLANSSLRLVEATDGPDLPLPLYPNHQRSQSSQVPQRKANTVSRRGNLVPCIPPLSVLSLRPASPQLHLVSGGLESADPATLQISQPYALAPNLSYVPSQGLSIGEAPRLLCGSSCPPLPAPTPKVDSLRTYSRKPLSQMASPSNSNSPMVSPSLAFSPKLASFPRPPLNPVTNTSLKQKMNLQPARARRSPAIGPSPLRSMILADPSDTSIAPQKLVETGTLDTSLGIAFPPSPYMSTKAGEELNQDDLGPPQELQLDIHGDHTIRRYSGASGRGGDEGDPGVLLGIIRELVEETSEWDASLFMDQNFKSLIQGHATKPLPNGNDPGVRFDISPPSVMLPDQSTDLDLALLGIDIFRSDGETFLPPKDTMRDNSEEVELISFWGERGWVNPHDKRSSIGLAW